MKRTTNRRLSDMGYTLDESIGITASDAEVFEEFLREFDRSTRTVQIKKWVSLGLLLAVAVSIAYLSLVF